MAPIRTVTMRELREHPPEPLHNLWGDGWITHPSLVHISGEQKTGKSLFVMQLLQAFVNPQTTTFLDVPVTRVGRVLYLQEEIPQRGVLDRAQLMWGKDDWSWCERFVLSPDRGISLEGDPERLLKIVTETGADVVALDPIARYHPWDENSNQAIGELLKRLLKAVQVGVTVIFVHHFRKPGIMDTNAHARPRGANRFLADPDTNIFLKTKDGGRTIEVDAELRNGEWPGPFTIIRDRELKFARFKEDTDGDHD